MKYNRKVMLFLHLIYICKVVWRVKTMTGIDTVICLLAVMINFFPSLSIHEDTVRKKAKTNLMQALNYLFIFTIRLSYVWIETF